ncbi:MAG: amidotransferase 1, exosortase A system-associated [Alphaproteobacteria bacterium]|nr:amidotransferase 1, exosortase A system-associated [Alphaproteobacteria bacterium]
MCGIAGLFDSRGPRPVDQPLLDRMNRVQAHRGPDGEGCWAAPGIGLAHRRLSIIDLAGGRQPMASEDGRLVVTFNGEIYNFPELMRELQAAGHVFRTRSDTEVILHAWREWGEDSLRRFRGMFAFALWDEARQTLALARDRFGKKPLHYARLPDGWVSFASEIKGLLVDPRLSRRLDPLAIESFLAFGYVPDPRSVWAGVAKLPPGHLMLWRRGEEPRLRQWWRPRLTAGRPVPLDEAAAELRDRMAEAVRVRLLAEVPLGAFLSGGVDSSGVVAMMAGAMAEPVKTFAISFAERGFDESAHAETLARRWGTDHTTRRLSPDSRDLVDRMAGVYDEPFADASAMPTFRVCALARERVAVALTGDGGDELFAGYRRYAFHWREERLRAAMPAAIRRPVFAALARLYPALGWAPRVFRARTTLRELSLDSARAYFNAVAVIPDPLRRSLRTPAFERELQGFHPGETVRALMAGADTDHPLLMAQAVDFATWLPGDILTKIDRASMANSLELRAPLLDHELAEWAGALDPRLKLRGGCGKAVLKRALEPLVPHELLYRPKQGFAVPLAAWFRGPLAERARDGARVLAGTGWFEPAALDRLLTRHRSGVADHGSALWTLLMLSSFLECHDLATSGKVEVA